MAGISTLLVGISVSESTGQIGSIPFEVESALFRCTWSSRPFYGRDIFAASQRANAIFIRLHVNL